MFDSEPPSVVAPISAPCASCPDHPELDAREALLLDYAARGQSLKLAAIELGLSNAGVSRIRRRALEKLGFDSVYAFLRSHASARAAAETMRSLTAAERDVASAVLAGLSNAEIARLRGTSACTVANQLAALYKKLRVGSRLELAAWWVRRHGLPASQASALAASSVTSATRQSSDGAPPVATALSRRSTSSQTRSLGHTITTRRAARFPSSR